ncbi:hypothetical protein Sru01_15770 [Sphaerisporangium rufum]|uniref:AB hydrolase-1 domain-containing protein n=1 Tax=Sphaerisporangium rufum TaxID=1381558 RepID=A0A919R3T2_9ACTN|nr:alpha/beta hydrolase [Sphaerisporangium rufum]GII76595.1 hypothetical protein Sru01_15770 [Sphaerisporangium rufum]
MIVQTEPAPVIGRPRSRAVTVLAVAGVVLAAALGGIAALLAVAALTAVPAVFVAAGIVTFVLLDVAGMALVARRSPPARRRAARWRLSAWTAVPLLALFAWTALVPPPVPPPAAFPGARLVRVATGSTLEVVRVPARAAGGGPPVVVVHGGPGVPDLAQLGRTYGRLAERGRDVYLYAEAGTGASTRSADPRGYSRERDVADLEALRARLGLDRMVLLGHSYGATVAAQYLTEHPGRVARLVLTSPGPPDPADRSGDLAQSRLDTARRLRVYAEVGAPRPMLGYLLLQVNPAAAHAFLPDAEADARNDRVLTLAGPALHCHGAPAPPPARGTGFYAAQYPQSASAPRPRDLRPGLAGVRVPALVFKGSCDYLSWRSAAEYRRLLPASRLVYLPGAGHDLHIDRPAEVVAAIEEFLAGRPPGLPDHPEPGPPPGYEGPA